MLHSFALTINASSKVHWAPGSPGTYRFPWERASSVKSKSNLTIQNGIRCSQKYKIQKKILLHSAVETYFWLKLMSRKKAPFVIEFDHFWSIESFDIKNSIVLHNHSKGTKEEKDDTTRLAKRHIFLLLKYSWVVYSLCIDITFRLMSVGRVA